MAAIIEKSLTEVAAVAYLRGIDNEGNSVKVATSNVTSNVTDGQDGASAFEVWKAKYGTPESTEDDYIAYLQKPCVVTSLSYENGLLTFKIGE